MTTQSPADQLPIDRLSLDELQSRHERARLQLETLQLESQLAAIAPEANRVVLEAWGDLIDPREHLYDTPNWGTRQGVPYTLLDDRADGRYRPIFETEQDLAMIRGAGRLLAEYFSAGLNIQSTLANYTIGPGFDYSVQAADGFDAPGDLIGAVQRVLDAMMNMNQWPADGEREAHERSREDGEALIQIVPYGWRSKLRFLEPDQLRDPQGFGRQLENWLGCEGEYASSWSFGVHTCKGVPGEPLGYHIVHDASGYDYEYVPAARMEHFKRNVPRNVKRGVSDFHPVTQWLNHAEKVLRNTATGAAVQAAIAFIRQHAMGTTSAQASGLAAGNAYSRTTQQTPLGNRTRNAQRYDPGTILDISYGLEYKSGPMGSERAPQFINVIQAALRYGGIRWSMPEYMTSGDASNASYSSTLVAESPFVKAREADQRQYKQFFHSLVWKTVRVAYEAGYFDRFGATWEQLQARIKIVVTPPAVATRDPLARAQAAEIEIRSGTLSRETAMSEAGRDPLAEAEKMRLEGGTETAGGEPAILPDAGGDVPADTNVAGTALNGAQVASLLDILGRVTSGNLPFETARGAIKAAFPLLSDPQIEAMMKPLVGFRPTADASGNPITPPAAGQSGGPPQEQSGEFGDKSRLQWKRNIKAIRDVLDDLISGANTPAMARELLLTLGLSGERADRLIADARDNQRVDDPEIAESLMESVVVLLERFSNDQPRGDDGKWIDTGQIAAALKSPAAKASLFNRVTDPKQRANLEKMIGPAPKGVAPVKVSKPAGGASSGKPKTLVGAEVHQRAEGVKHDVAKKIGGIVEELTDDPGQKDKKVYDVKLKTKNGDHDIEVKSLQVGQKQKISVHNDALLRKVEHAQGNPKNTFHTVVLDKRGELGNEAYSGHPIYYKRGSGAYSLSQMHKAKDYAELKRLILMPDDKLPEAARGTLPPPPPLKELQAKAARDSESRRRRDKIRKERNRELLNRQAREARARKKAGG